MDKRVQACMNPCTRKQGAPYYLGLNSKVPKGCFGQGLQGIGALGCFLGVNEYPPKYEARGM